MICYDGLYKLSPDFEWLDFALLGPVVQEFRYDEELSLRQTVHQMGCPFGTPGQLTTSPASPPVPETILHMGLKYILYILIYLVIKTTIGVMHPLSVRDNPDHLMVDLSTFIDLPVSSLILLFF